MAVRTSQSLLIIIISAGILTLAGCLPPRDHAQLPTVSPDMATWAATQWSDTSAAQLSHGRETMENHCTACHSMPSPLHETVKDWPDVMQDMADHAKLGNVDQQAMLRYILAARNFLPGSG